MGDEIPNDSLLVREMHLIDSDPKHHCNEFCETRVRGKHFRHAPPYQFRLHYYNDVDYGANPVWTIVAPLIILEVYLIVNGFTR